VVLALVLVVDARAQSDLQARRESTEERLTNLKEQIDRSQSRLQEATEAEQATQEKLDNLEREIALREELVAT
jgi:predicted  nucleic acid-binding Zn-ribbon protein